MKLKFDRLPDWALLPLAVFFLTLAFASLLFCAFFIYNEAGK